MAKDALRHLNRYRPGLKGQVEATIPRSSLMAIRDTPSMGWVPIEFEHHVSRSIFAVLGDRGEDYFRWLFVNHLRKAPLLAPVIDRAMKLFGLDPGQMMRLAPTAFTLAFRGFCGDIESDRSHMRASFHLLDCHEAVFGCPSYPRSWRGAIRGTFDLSHMEGAVEMEIDEPSRAVRYMLRW